MLHLLSALDLCLSVHVDNIVITHAGFGHVVNIADFVSGLTLAVTTLLPWLVS